ncbi:hypothetical protein AB0B30_05120 [Streptomyces narbonensis]|uniref:Integral membrane protein n=1 Tax=Streptomyces narbonensis TaxID=67333 RepID=A0ABV3C551_9ACTN
MPQSTPAADSRAPHAWIAPTASTVVTLPLVCLAFLSVVLDPLSCDDCSGANTVAYRDAYLPAFWTFLIGLLLPLGLLVASWALPPSRRHTARRRTVALLAPTAVVLLYLLFLLLVGRR